MHQPSVELWTTDFILILLINFLVFMNHLMILSTFPFYIEYLGGSERIAGLAAALFSIVAVLCRPVIGWMLDNGKRKCILIIGLCGMCLMPVGYLVLATMLLAFVCRMLHGASLAFPIPQPLPLQPISSRNSGLPKAWVCLVWLLL